MKRQIAPLGSVSPPTAPEHYVRQKDLDLFTPIIIDGGKMWFNRDVSTSKFEIDGGRLYFLGA
jgi:hypothetical protein